MVGGARFGRSVPPAKGTSSVVSSAMQILIGTNRQH
jgi:hypothetical protein